MSDNPFAWWELMFLLLIIGGGLALFIHNEGQRLRKHQRSKLKKRQRNR